MNEMVSPIPMLNSIHLTAQLKTYTFWFWFWWYL